MMVNLHCAFQNIRILTSWFHPKSSVHRCKSCASQKHSTTHGLRRTPTSTHTAPTRSTSLCTLFGLELLSDPHCSSAPPRGNTNKQEQDSQKKKHSEPPRAEHFHGHGVIRRLAGSLQNRGHLASFMWSGGGGKIGPAWANSRP